MNNPQREVLVAEINDLHVLILYRRRLIQRCLPGLPHGQRVEDLASDAAAPLSKRRRNVGFRWN